VSSIFPSAQWPKNLETKLNSDEKYAQVVKIWEGELFFFINPEYDLDERLTFYLDVWHGSCWNKILTPNFESSRMMFCSPNNEDTLEKGFTLVL